MPNEHRFTKPFHPLGANTTTPASTPCEGTCTCAPHPNYPVQPPAPSGPTQEEVREALSYLTTCAFETLQSFVGGKEEPCDRAQRAGRILLAALEHAQEEARIMTVSRDHYVSELALAQGEVREALQNHEAIAETLRDVLKERDALRAENARLVEEIARVCERSAKQNEQQVSMAEENAAQAEQIKRLREALHLISHRTMDPFITGTALEALKP